MQKSWEKRTREEETPVALRRTMLKTNQVVDEKPVCFGKQYSSTAPECVGGHDPAFLHEENGSHVRDRCSFASSCASHLQAVRNASGPVHVPTANLTRPAAPYSQPAPRPQWSAPYQAPPYQPPAYQTPNHIPGGHAFQQMMPVNHYMPPYLSVRQPAVAGQGMGKRLAIEVLRSLGKSAGHTISNFFDNEVFGNNSDRGNKPNEG